MTALERGAEPAAEADWAGLLRSALPDEPYPVDAVRAVLGNQPARSPVRVQVLHRGAVVGVGAGSLVDGTGYVDLVVVHPEHHHHGVGRRVLSILERELVAAGARTVSRSKARIGWAAETAIPFYVRTVGAEVAESFWTMSKVVTPRPVRADRRPSTDPKARS